MAQSKNMSIQKPQIPIYTYRETRKKQKLEKQKHMQTNGQAKQNFVRVG